MFPFPSPLLMQAASAGGGGASVVAGTQQKFLGSSGTITLPSYAAGDLVLIHVAAFSSSGTSFTTPPVPPAGWDLVTSLMKKPDTINNQWILGRRMDGSEGSTLAHSWGGSNQFTLITPITISGAVASGLYSEAVTTSFGTFSTYPTNISSPAITTLGIHRLCLNFLLLQGGSSGLTNTGTADAWDDVSRPAFNLSPIITDSAISKHDAPTSGLQAVETVTVNAASATTKYSFIGLATILA